MFTKKEIAGDCQDSLGMTLNEEKAYCENYGLVRAKGLYGVFLRELSALGCFQHYYYTE